jgi:deoxyribodipyrimidine photolyase-related protein
MTARRTVVVLGDQLNRTTGALADVGPEDVDVRMVISRAKLRQRPYHRAKLHLVLSAMRRFADELQEEGFEVRLDTADTFADGLGGTTDPVVMAPSSWDLRQRLDQMGVSQVPNDAFVVGEQGFADWADGRKTLQMEWFYREMRKDTGWLMDGREPAGGEWNYDHDNREKPPRDGKVDAPAPWTPTEDDVDTAVRQQVSAFERALDLELYGSMDQRFFPTTREESLAALDDFLAHRLDGFGPLEDAVIDGEPTLWHSLLSVPLNYGLLHPREVGERVDALWRDGADVRLNSLEGFLRQVCGWREYVWGIYWLRMPDWRTDNHLGQTGAVPEAFWTAETDMACVRGTVTELLQRGWNHHIPRLMILGSYGLLVGADPQQLTDWFHSMYVDAFDWVMAPNVVGMSQWADGGVMATKPYTSGAAYINKMTTYCKGCAFDPKTRTEDDSCPFNSLYWDFLSRHRSTLSANRRMAPIMSNLDRFGDAERRGIRDRARTFRTDG